MNLLLLGPPGSGKGTQARKLSQKLNLTHISSGRLLRDEVAKNNSTSQTISVLIKQGKLLPFEIIKKLILPKIRLAGKGFILDGTPRNIAQAKEIEKLTKQEHLSIDAVILLTLDDKIAIKRLLKRASKEHRTDDNTDIIRNRLKIYSQEINPIIKYYKSLSIPVINIDASPDIETIFQDILKNITPNQKQIMYG